MQLGSEVHGILLWPLGGLAFMGKSSSPREDLMVAGAGPLTHIPQVRLLCLQAWTTFRPGMKALYSGTHQQVLTRAADDAVCFLGRIILRGGQHSR